jgi:rare lipoprotein A
MRLNRLAYLLVLILAACSTAPTKPQKSTYTNANPRQDSDEIVETEYTSVAENNNAQVCRQTMQHDERNYTAGGLYAPGISDASPLGDLDISRLQEPIPRNEPKSKYGNRSPYKVLNKKYTVLDTANGYKERGISSWYGTKFHGRATSSQEIYDMCQFSAAHKSLPIPSYVRVTRLDTGQSVIVRVNDRGPFHEGRIIDLSFAAATKLGINKVGTAKVEVEAINVSELVSVPPLVDESHLALKQTTLAPETNMSNRSFLQIASFSNKDNAQALLERLQQAQIKQAFIKKSQVNHESVWRVRIGPLIESEIGETQNKLNELDLKGLRVSSE